MLCCQTALCAMLCPVQAKGTDAYEPLSDDNMDVETGEARVEARQRGRRGKGEPRGCWGLYSCVFCEVGPVQIFGLHPGSKACLASALVS